MKLLFIRQQQSYICNYLIFDGKSKIRLHYKRTLEEKILFSFYIININQCKLFHLYEIKYKNISICALNVH